MFQRRDLYLTCPMSTSDHRDFEQAEASPTKNTRPEPNASAADSPRYPRSVPAALSSPMPANKPSVAYATPAPDDVRPRVAYCIGAFHLLCAPHAWKDPSNHGITSNAMRSGHLMTKVVPV